MLYLINALAFGMIASIWDAKGVANIAIKLGFATLMVANSILAASVLHLSR